MSTRQNLSLPAGETPYPDRPPRFVLAVVEGDATSRWIAALAARPARLFITSCAETAVERALADGPDGVVLHSALPGVGAAVAADILRRAGVGCRIAVLHDDTAPAWCGDELRLFDDLLHLPVRTQEIDAMMDAARRHSLHTQRLSRVAPDISDLQAQFLAGLPDHLAALRAAAAQGDVARTRALAHSLKGSAGAFGRPDLTRGCGEIEQHIEQGRVAQAMELAHHGLSAEEPYKR